MKVNKKQKRKLHHGGTDFLYVVNKNDDGVTLRIYTKQFKSTYCSFSITWQEAHDINLNLPRVVKGILVSAIEAGWAYDVSNKQLKVEKNQAIVAKLKILSEE